MTGILEIVLLVFAILLVAFLLFDLLRGRSSGRAARERLARMRGEEEVEEVLPPRPGRYARLLRAAGIRFGVVPFAIAMILVGALLFVALWRALPNAPLAALLIALVLVYVLHMMIREWGRFRARRFERHLVDAVDYMVSALMAGENPTQALSSAASAAEGAVRTEFKEVVNRLALGMSIREALARMVTRYDSEGTRLFSQTLAVKWTAGGDLAPVLRSVAWIMRERIRLNMRLRTELTGVQVAGLLIALLPYVLIPFFLWRRPGWADTLTGHPWGPPLLVGAIVLQIVGLLWLRRVLRIEL